MSFCYVPFGFVWVLSPRHIAWCQIFRSSQLWCWRSRHITCWLTAFSWARNVPYLSFWGLWCPARHNVPFVLFAFIAIVCRGSVFDGLLWTSGLFFSVVPPSISHAISFVSFCFSCVCFSSGSIIFGFQYRQICLFCDRLVDCCFDPSTGLVSFLFERWLNGIGLHCHCLRRFCFWWPFAIVLQAHHVLSIWFCMSIIAPANHILYLSLSFCLVCVLSMLFLSFVSALALILIWTHCTSRDNGLHSGTSRVTSFVSIELQLQVLGTSYACHLFLICLVASLITWCGSDTRDRYFFIIWKISSLKSICFSALSFPLLLFMNTVVQWDIFSEWYFFNVIFFRVIFYQPLLFQSSCKSSALNMPFVFDLFGCITRHVMWLRHSW